MKTKGFKPKVKNFSYLTLITESELDFMRSHWYKYVIHKPEQYFDLTRDILNKSINYKLTINQQQCLRWAYDKHFKGLETFVKEWVKKGHSSFTNGYENLTNTSLSTRKDWRIRNQLFTGHTSVIPVNCCKEADPDILSDRKRQLRAKYVGKLLELTSEFAEEIEKTVKELFHTEDLFYPFSDFEHRYTINPNGYFILTILKKNINNQNSQLL